MDSDLSISKLLYARDLKGLTSCGNALISFCVAISMVHFGQIDTANSDNIFNGCSTFLNLYMKKIFTNSGFFFVFQK